MTRGVKGMSTTWCWDIQQLCWVAAAKAYGGGGFAVTEAQSLSLSLCVRVCLYVLSNVFKDS